MVDTDLMELDLPNPMRIASREALASLEREGAPACWQAWIVAAREHRPVVDAYSTMWRRLLQLDDLGAAPMWWPDEQVLASAHLSLWMRELGFKDLAELHRWSVTDRSAFWRYAIDRLGIRFSSPPETILDDSAGAQQAVWLPNARLNIVESCFTSDAEQIAVVYQRPGGEVSRLTYGQLRHLANRVSNGLVRAGFAQGDSIAVVLPMTAMSIPIYLGIVQAGCVVVSIADSFAPPEIAKRLDISGAKAVFTYDHLIRNGKSIPLFSRVAEATDLPLILLPAAEQVDVTLRRQDMDWVDFLPNNSLFEPVICEAHAPINILFSSGTTGDPKAIPWDHLTPIKCAVDGLLHQDIHTGQVITWPTNLGWMMGPWLIFASLINRATIGLYEDAPTSAEFGKFVQDARVNVLGVVPSIVRAWRDARCMEGWDWSNVCCFSSTGEASDADDMFYLSSLAGMKPVIEYCGGTEIGGGYITSTVVQPNIAAAFTTPAMGLDFVILDSDAAAADEGELFLVPPSVGLSYSLLNRDHFETYYAETPISPEGQLLRRHGDHMQRRDDGSLVAGGRVDDTMNLGGIKIASVEIERVLNGLEGIRETAAVAISEKHGPQQLAVFVVADGDPEIKELTARMNACLKQQLNPLFKVHRVERLDRLPRTASNKVMRRTLRARLTKSAAS